MDVERRRTDRPMADSDRFINERRKVERRQKQKRKTMSQLKTEKQQKNILKVKSPAEDEEIAAESQSFYCA